MLALSLAGTSCKGPATNAAMAEQRRRYGGDAQAHRRSTVEGAIGSLRARGQIEGN